ncbi:uncharacterized protein LOC126842565 [Adelges cooleyi]|uniref:uncharacterized protein LOC126842565 n=1 Tax=Adelges cooleyi TaxID=133065 RepID=UPI00217FD51D|nr:uncharacterized protein LOC126842565 [Adelges cooleyi]XP_050435562.1 uncharacterized protein LOC126842565 [Adelges cooleyi]
MRRFCFLISSVVLNVLAVLEIHHDKFLVELIKQTNLTNRQIRRVQCGDVRLIPVIKQFVLADKPMTDLSLMFAGPFVVSEPNHDDETLQHRIDLEIELQTAITTLLGKYNNL